MKAQCLTLFSKEIPMATTNTKSLTKTQLEAMLETKEEALRQHKALHEAHLLEANGKIAALQAQVDALVAKTGRPVAKETPAGVKALPVLQADPKTGRCLCPTDAEHGSVSPNTKGLCPKCYTHAIWVASPAGQAALKAAA
jgi:hypothetical protein